MTSQPEKNTGSGQESPEPSETPAFLMSLEDVRRDPRRAGKLFAEHFGLSGGPPEDDRPTP